MCSHVVPGEKEVIKRAKFALNCARMEVRADKCRSIIIKKGRVLNVTRFSFDHSQTKSLSIPSIHSSSIKFLGQLIDHTLSDRKAIDESEQKLSDGLLLIDKSFLSKSAKLWVLQHLLIPRIKWHLMIYEIPHYRAVILKRSISKYIRKWLALCIGFILLL